MTSSKAVQFYYYRTVYNKNGLEVLYRGRNPEPEPPGKHGGKELVPLDRKKPWAYKEEPDEEERTKGKTMTRRELTLAVKALKVWFKRAETSCPALLSFPG